MGNESEKTEKAGLGGGGGGGGGTAPAPSYTPMPVIPNLIQEERRGVQLIPGQEHIRTR